MLCPFLSTTAAVPPPTRGGGRWKGQRPPSLEPQLSHARAASSSSHSITAAWQPGMVGVGDAITSTARGWKQYSGIQWEVVVVGVAAAETVGPPLPRHSTRMKGTHEGWETMSVVRSTAQSTTRSTTRSRAVRERYSTVADSARGLNLVSQRKSSSSSMKGAKLAHDCSSVRRFGKRGVNMRMEVAGVSTASSLSASSSWASSLAAPRPAPAAATTEW